MTTRDGKARETLTMCPHCRKKSETGTHGGCHDCGKVKHNFDGRRNFKKVKAAR